MTTVLNIAMPAVQEIASDFRTLFKEFIIAKLAQSELAMVHSTQREVLFAF